MFFINDYFSVLHYLKCKRKAKIKQIEKQKDQHDFKLIEDELLPCACNAATFEARKQKKK